jgi:serine/threonine protein phosphatase 1
VPGRTIAIGDIHGCHIALNVLLNHLEITSEDTVVVLGDVVDRGPGTKQAIDRLLQLQNECRLVFILGNHEEMFFDAMAGGGWRKSWSEFGGKATLDSYGGEFDDIPPEHVEFLKSGLDYFETETDIFVHASLEPDVPLAEQSPDFLRWRKLTGDEQPHRSGKRVICGHTPIASGLPAVLPGWVDLDTWAYHGLYLTALEVGSDRVFQSQQSGAFRGGLTLADL